MVEFVSYNGKYPNLCRGTLIIKVNGKETILKNCLMSGGRCWIDRRDWEGHIEKGYWRLCTCLPDDLEQCRDEILKVVNENVLHGCCGGCI
jgi:uncharacterized Fe-S radical SAM superfamily protein PflX